MSDKRLLSKEDLEKLLTHVIREDGYWSSEMVRQHIDALTEQRDSYRRQLEEQTARSHDAQAEAHKAWEQRDRLVRLLREAEQWIWEDSRGMGKCTPEETDDLRLRIDQACGGGADTREAGDRSSPSARAGTLEDTPVKAQGRDTPATQDACEMPFCSRRS